LNVGMPRSGKSMGIRTAIIVASERVPVMIVRRLGSLDWKTWPRSVAPRAARVSSVARGARAVDAGKRLVVVETKDPLATVVEACAWARDRPGVAGVVLTEAHRYFPNSTAPLPQPVADCVFEWAHYEVAFYVDSQRFARLHKDITEMATGGETRLYAILGPRDRAKIAEELDPELLPVLDEIKRRWAGGSGERGWYVRLPGAAPYALSRNAP
jgi:hypothetical protein